MQLKYFALVVALSASIPASSFACTPVGQAEISVKKFTNYSPLNGGINGRCGTSASGLNACKYFLEDYLAEKTNAVMVAVPQPDCPKGYKWVGKGKKKRKVACTNKCPEFQNPELFGGTYRSANFEKALATGLGKPVSCVQLAAGDRYGTSGNCVDKMDVVTRKGVSKYSKIINDTMLIPGSMIPLGRIDNMKPPSRKLERDPAATLDYLAEQHKQRPLYEEFGVMTPEKIEAEKKMLNGKKYRQLPETMEIIPTANPNRVAEEEDIILESYGDEFGALTKQRREAEMNQQQNGKFKKLPITIDIPPEKPTRSPASAE